MHAFPIRNEADHERALSLIDELWDAEPGTPEADLLHVMSGLVHEFERAQRTLPPADPVALIAFKLKEFGWSQRRLARELGWGAGRISEILARKRPLTLNMVRELSRALDLPPGLLVHEPLDDAEAWVKVDPDTARELEARSARSGRPVSALIHGLLFTPNDPFAGPQTWTLTSALAANSGSPHADAVLVAKGGSA